MTDPADMLNMSVRDFTTATAAKAPTPGGGSVAGVVGALGTSLGQMSLAYSRGKKAFADQADLHEHLAERLARAHGMFQDLVADDLAAFGMYSQAAEQPEGDDRDEAMSLAMAACIDVPRQMAKLALAVLDDFKALAGACTPWLVSDLAAAARLAAVTTDLCDYNVRVNTSQLADAEARQELRTASQADRTKAALLADEIEALVQSDMDGTDRKD